MGASPLAVAKSIYYTDRGRGKFQISHVKTACGTVIFKTLALMRVTRILSHKNHESGKFQSFHVQTA